MIDADMMLHNSISGNEEVAETFSFAVDTCENFAKYTGRTTCQPNEMVEPLISSFIVTTKLSQQFFSADTYA